MAHGKNYRNAKSLFEREHEYSPAEAVRIIKEMPTAKFDETIEVHFRLGLNVRHADEQLRGTLMLPHGTGKDAKVAVFAEGDKAKEAQEAGADVVGSADLAKRVEEGFTDFDVAIATPDQMGNVGKLGRILGPRGLMPNPKTGTVTMDVGKAVRDAKAGKLEYRTDRGANVHVAIGKKSFDERQLVENYAALVEEIVRAKPAVAKGRYIRQITLRHYHGPRNSRRHRQGPWHRRRARGDTRSSFGLVNYARRQRPAGKRGGGRSQRQRPSSRGGSVEEVFASFSEPACVRARFVRGGE